MAEIKMPPFTKGKKQLEKYAVERVIGNLKQKYTVLQSILPVHFCNGSNELTIIDKIVFLCNALTNLCPSVIPQD